jgi:hypothetical protein
MVFAGVALLGSCRSNKEESPRPVASEKAQPVTLDLRFTAPTGYEFCAGKSSRGDSADPQKLPHKNLDLTIRLPSKIELPPDAHGAKEIVFRPGRHEVDVYKHLDSGRLIAAHGMITMDGDTPTLRVKLDMSQWPPGRYVIGISGDPFFGYCTMDFQ